MLRLTVLSQISIQSINYTLKPCSRLLSKCPRLITSTRIEQPETFTKKFSTNIRPDEPKQDLTSPENQKKLILTIPNLLTSLRIISIPFINYYFFTGRHDVACGLFIMASLTDFLDGYIARNFPNQLSHLGSILDPLADKLLIGSLTFTLMLTNMLPFPLFAVIISRDIGLVLSSLYIRYQIIDEPKTFKKYVNLKNYASVKIEADYISKLNTVFQLALISVTLPSVMLGYSDSNLLVYLQLITGFTTCLSAGSYLYKRGSYKLK